MYVLRKMSPRAIDALIVADKSSERLDDFLNLLLKKMDEVVYDSGLDSAGTKYNYRIVYCRDTGTPTTYTIQYVDELFSKRD